MERSERDGGIKASQPGHFLATMRTAEGTSPEDGRKQIWTQRYLLCPTTSYSALTPSLHKVPSLLFSASPIPQVLVLDPTCHTQLLQRPLHVSLWEGPPGEATEQLHRVLAPAWLLPTVELHIEPHSCQLFPSPERLGQWGPIRQPDLKGKRKILYREHHNWVRCPSKEKEQSWLLLPLDWTRRITIENT